MKTIRNLTKQEVILMENIIKKAIEGGYKHKNVETPDEEPAMIRFVSQNPHKILLDHLFWQALSKSCGWLDYTNYTESETWWLYYAKKFLEINLTDSFESAVEWLENIIK